MPPLSAPVGDPLAEALVDGFDEDVARGRVVGSATRDGHSRGGADAEGTLSIDHGALRITPLVRPGWGRSTLAHGPFAPTDGLVASVVLTNGRNGSDDLDAWPSPLGWVAQWLRGTQSDPPFRNLLRRLAAGGRDGAVRGVLAAVEQGRRADAERGPVNLAVGWSASPAGDDPDTAPATVVRSTGPHNAELAVTGGWSGLSPRPLAELPMRLVLVRTEGRIVHLAAVDDGSGRWPVADVVGIGPEPSSPPAPAWFTVQQRVLGQAGWRMDTRVSEVRVERLDDPPSLDELVAEGFGRSDAPSSLRSYAGAPETVVDRFGSPGALDGREIRDVEGVGAGAGDGTVRWAHVIGRRRIVVRSGAAHVDEPVPGPQGRVARLRRPSGQRTAYVVPWRRGAGRIETEIVPPGTGPGDGERGRAGLILWEDADNHLIVNDWLDEEYGGASVSVFRRAGGVEDVYSAVWANVGAAITWGRPHVLAVGFDDDGFTAFLDARPVLTREFVDLSPGRRRLVVRAVGICANWEFGDDTGSRFSWFRARRAPAPVR